MGSFALMLCVRCASILWSSTFASMTRSILKTGLRRLSNFWSPRNLLLRWISKKIKLPCELIALMVPMMKERNCSVGATSDCQYCEICVTVENENTPICRRGILTELRENCFERAVLVLIDGLDNLILARRSFFINLLLVNCG